jgi:hypothetical protein
MLLDGATHAFRHGKTEFGKGAQWPKKQKTDLHVKTRLPYAAGKQCQQPVRCALWSTVPIR